MLELENIHKSFAHNENIIDVLKGLNMVVHQGESVAITGASGVGKSTLLNIIGTLEEPSKGVVRFDSKDINSNPDFQIGCQQCGAFRSCL